MALTVSRSEKNDALEAERNKLLHRATIAEEWRDSDRQRAIDAESKLAKAVEALSRIHKWVDCYATHSDLCKRGTRCTCGLTIERMKLHDGYSSLAAIKGDENTK